MANSDPELDAEYRSFIRSLHQETVNTVLEAESWWRGDTMRIAVLGGYSPEDERDSKEVSDALEQTWRSTVVPRLHTLVHGHPDPDVRFAADILEKRLWSISMIISRPWDEDWLDGDDDERRRAENSVTVHLAHDGFTRLHRAVYHAPFRVTRPSPRYDGIAVGNAEPLPGRILDTIRELQDAGVLEREAPPLRGFAIAEAVRRISDIFFMPEDERAALFKDNNVADPVGDGGDNRPIGFGFRSSSQ
ncbi:hypothetical protein [Gordonia sp. IITR100]|uniref:hypothetical protein n=1 Tax=Gordonia sp. IITR100 TaxID=1314686 RepID=UPI000990DC91|nr:hypothetical protein [Gordonia sp. IITR100]